MKKYIGLLAVLLLLLAGCRGGREDTTTVSVDKKGRVTAVIVERLDAPYYDVQELETMVQDTVNDYNEEQSEKLVSLEQCSYDEKSGQVSLTMSYTSCDTYADFNQVTFYEGELSEGLERFPLEGKLLDPGGNEIAPESIRSGEGETRVVITNEPIAVKTRRSILAVSENTRISGEKAAQVLPEDDRDNVNAQTAIHGYAYIIYE